MIENRLEYQRMYETERKLWWYLALHEKVLDQILTHFGMGNTQIRILDAACGTGGLLSFLRECDYRQLVGFDYSQHAIDFCTERVLQVGFGDLRNVCAFRPGETFDVICCNDALYFLTDDEITTALTALKHRLKSGGILIVNIHAFEAFSGMHDLAVGSSRRFRLKQFKTFSKAAGLKIVHNTYWPFTLSLPILLVRQWQKYKLRNQKIEPDHLESDVKFPGNTVNEILKRITRTETLMLNKTPFGSSLFMTMQADQ